jgi:hypothetical protein
MAIHSPHVLKPMFVCVSTLEILNVSVLELFLRAINVRHANSKEVWPQTSDGVLGYVCGEL